MIIKYAVHNTKLLILETISETKLVIQHSQQALTLRGMMLLKSHIKPSEINIKE